MPPGRNPQNTEELAMPTPPRMSTADTALLVIDMQEKLLPKIAGVEHVVQNLSFLLEAAS